MRLCGQQTPRLPKCKTSAKTGDIVGLVIVCDIVHLVVVQDTDCCRTLSGAAVGTWGFRRKTMSEMKNCCRGWMWTGPKCRWPLSIEKAGVVAREAFITQNKSSSKSKINNVMAFFDWNPLCGEIWELCQCTWSTARINQVNLSVCHAVLRKSWMHCATGLL